MPATTGQLAGTETNATLISYGVEAVYGTAPAVQFQALRYTAESLKLTKTRQFPNEINNSRETQQGVTTQQIAGGSINYALSYTTFDDFMASVLQADWQAAVVIAGVAADITLTSGTGVLSSGTAGKFTNIVQGQWIRLLGFTNAVNNGWWYVAVKTSALLLTLAGPNFASIVTETPTGTLAQVRASNIRNGSTFKSLFIQQKLATSQYLTYPGAYPSRMTFTGGIGNFFTGAIDLVVKDEVKATVEGSTGAVLAAPLGRVIDPVGGFVGAFWNEAPIGNIVDQASWTIENTGAAGQFVMGSASAVGMMGGTYKASGTFRALFSGFTQYDLFRAETAGRLAFIVKDPAGSSYVFTFFSAVLTTADITAGGPGQSVYATFGIEAGPSAVPGTFQIDRLPAV